MAHRDGSGTITFDEFKSVFSSHIGPDAIPFNFDWFAPAFLARGDTNHLNAYFSDWVKLYLGRKNGAHVLGCGYLLHNRCWKWR